MVKRQVVEEVSSRIVEIILRKVGLVTEAARELSEVQCQAIAHRSNVGAINLPEWALDLRAELVGRVPLHGFSRLAIHQIQTHAEAASGVDVRRALDRDDRLVKAEVVARHVVSAEQVNAPNGANEDIAVVTVNCPSE